MQRVQAQTVAWIHPLLNVTTPRNYVAGYQQLRQINSCYAAAAVVGCKHGGTEKMLIDASTNNALSLFTLLGKIGLVKLGDLLKPTS